jgi:hypothetical protein
LVTKLVRLQLYQRGEPSIPLEQISGSSPSVETVKEQVVIPVVHEISTKAQFYNRFSVIELTGESQNSTDPYILVDAEVGRTSSPIGPVFDTFSPSPSIPYFGRYLYYDPVTTHYASKARRGINRSYELVGVEENPGPNKGKKKGNSTALVHVPTVGQKKPSEYKDPNAPAVRAANKRAEKFKQKLQAHVSKNLKARSFGISQGMTDIAKYLQCLNNPFDNLPVRLGGETMMPTGLATFTQRGTVVLPAGGNYSIVKWPNQNWILVSASLNNPYTYAKAISGPSLSAFMAVANEARVVAAGIRVSTMAPATSNGGILSIGCLPRDRLAAAYAATVATSLGFPYGDNPTPASCTQGANEIFQYIQTEQYPLREGGSAIYRPEDPYDYIFHDYNVDPTAIQALEDVCPFFVCGVVGASASTNLFIECVTHMEYTVKPSFTGIINTELGQMSTVQSFGAAKALLGEAQTTGYPGVDGGYHKESAFRQIAKGGVKLLGDVFSGGTLGSTLSQVVDLF